MKRRTILAQIASVTNYGNEIRETVKWKERGAFYTQEFSYPVIEPLVPGTEVVVTIEALEGEEKEVPDGIRSTVPVA